MNNKFIVFEGLDGSGKTTLSRLYYEWLLENGTDVELITCGYPIIDNAIQEIKNNRVNYDIRVHFLLAMSNSIMTYNTQVQPNLNRGKFVILDRYYFTTLAYNMALGLNEDWAKNVALTVPLPDKVIFCNAGIDKHLERKIKKLEDIELGFSIDSDRQSSFINYQSRVKSYYDKLIEQNPNLFEQIDTNKSFEECLEKIKILGRRKDEKSF